MFYRNVFTSLKDKNMFPQYPCMPYYCMPQQNLISDINYRRSAYQAEKPKRHYQMKLKRMAGVAAVGSLVAYFYAKVLNQPGVYDQAKKVGKKVISWIKIK